jgi:hypothetical protein
MSHTVTVTRTTTATTTSAIIINTGYLKTWPGILKFLQVLLGAVVVGILAYYYDNYYRAFSGSEMFYFLMAVTFLIASFLLILSCLCSLSTGAIISKTTYEVIFHGAAFVLYLIAAGVFLANVSRGGYKNQYECYMAAGVIGLIISGLYLGSTIFASKSYRGL